MANFTITRQVESSDNYGCTNFETNQFAGDTASLTSGDPLDGSIVWILDANPGYTVNVNDFDIPGTQPTSVTQTSTYRTFENTLPPVLGVVFEQFSATRIIITLYLHPILIHGIQGVPFPMPGNAVSTTIMIKGCAVLIPKRINIGVRDGGTGEVDVTTNISKDGTLAKKDAPNGEFHVVGHIPQDELDKEIFSYTINAKPGERFVVEPNFSISTSDHYVKSSTTKDDSGNIISTTFKVFK